MRKLIIIIFILTIAVTFGSCKKANNNSDIGYDWGNYSLDSFRKYIAENEQDFICVYDMLCKYDSIVVINFIKPNYITWEGHGSIEHFFTDSEIDKIENIIYKHGVIYFYVDHESAKFQSSEVDSGHFFFTYYPEPSQEQRSFINLIDKWGITYLGN